VKLVAPRLAPVVEMGPFVGEACLCPLFRVVLGNINESRDALQDGYIATASDARQAAVRGALSNSR